MDGRDVQKDAKNNALHVLDYECDAAQVRVRVRVRLGASSTGRGYFLPYLPTDLLTYLRGDLLTYLRTAYIRTYLPITYLPTYLRTHRPGASVRTAARAAQARRVQPVRGRQPEAERERHGRGLKGWEPRSGKV